MHGHLDRLQALIEKAGVEPQHPVIQLGDLGHYGATQSPRADADTWEWADGHIHRMCWGNHDAAVFMPQHIFGGYKEPFYETKDVMKRFMTQDRIHLAYEAHGFVLTHAGLAKAFKMQHVDDAIKKDPKRFVEWVQDMEVNPNPPMSFIGLRDAISVYRGGGSNAGGILWRDASEKLYPNFRQVFGHTARDGKIRRYPSTAGTSYCIDVGTATNGRLAGIWLPSEEIVDVQVLP